MKYINRVTLVGEIVDRPVEKWINQDFLVAFTLKTGDQTHMVIAKNDIARGAQVALQQGRIFYIVGSIHTTSVSYDCDRCSKHHNNRLTRIIAEDIVYIGDGAHYSQKLYS